MTKNIENLVTDYSKLTLKTLKSLCDERLLEVDSKQSKKYYIDCLEEYDAYIANNIVEPIEAEANIGLNSVDINNGEYKSMAHIATIEATSRISVKIQDTFYTFEYKETRNLPDVEGIDIELERMLLWESAHREVDKQVEDVVNL